VTTQRWVVGVDGSDDSKTALAWAVAQATGRDAQIVALCTWLAPILPSDAIGQPALLMDWDRFEAELRRHLDGIIASVRFAGAAVVPEITACVQQGKAARTLIENSEGAELLVVGTKGRGGLSGVVLGSVSRQCATHATVPVAVVPADTLCMPVRHLVVGFDGSPNAREAVEWALQFAPAGAQIDVVRAVDIVPWSDQATIRERFPTEVEMASAEFEAAMDEVDPARRARRSLQLQDARQALCEAAHDADLVVLGARGHGRLGAALLGSVSTWILHAPSHATVIVPRHHE
jgi:nucleotide-binding universal stress UspA family protein